MSAMGSFASGDSAERKYATGRRTAASSAASLANHRQLSELQNPRQVARLAAHLFVARQLD